MNRTHHRHPKYFKYLLKLISDKAQEALSHFNISISESVVGHRNMQDPTYCNLYISYVSYQSNSSLKGVYQSTDERCAHSFCRHHKKHGLKQDKQEQSLSGKKQQEKHLHLPYSETGGRRGIKANQNNNKTTTVTPSNKLLNTEKLCLSPRGACESRKTCYRLSYSILNRNTPFVHYRRKLVKKMAFVFDSVIKSPFRLFIAATGKKKSTYNWDYHNTVTQN